MKLELTLSPEPDTTIDKLKQWVQDAWNNLSQDDIRHLYDRLYARIHTGIAARGGTLCIDVTVWAPLSMTRFTWSEFVIIYFYNDKLPVTSNCNTMNFSLRVFHF